MSLRLLSNTLHLIGILSTVLIVSATLNIVLNENIRAADLSQFDAGNIIDDDIFYNPYSMNSTQIQAFLESKVSNCRQGYTCLKDYAQETVEKPADRYCSGYTKRRQKASEIINDVAKNCGISPQAIIVILQKENGLVTDNAAENWQYRTAMGYGCPDTDVCDSQYFGFFNQVYNAARQYKVYQIRPELFNYRSGRYNTILYHPSGQASCGYSQIFISNQATAGLYNYTPYQPNKEALNAGYGLGNRCSSYGNRNFYSYFTDWFGSTAGKDLIRTIDDGSLYYSDGEFKYKINSMSLAREFGWSDGNVGFVSQAKIDSLKTPTEGSTTLTPVIRDESGNIFLIANGQKNYIGSMDIINNLMFNDKIVNVSNKLSNKFSEGRHLTNFFKDDSGLVFRISNGNRRAIFQGVLLNQYNPSNVQLLSVYLMNYLFTKGSPEILGDLAVRSDNGQIWHVEDDTWSPVNSMDSFACSGLSSFIDFSTTKNNIGNKRGEPLSCVVKDQQGNGYILDRNQRYSFAQASNNTPIIKSSISSKLPSVEIDGTGFIMPDGKVYEIADGKKAHIISMQYVEDSKIKLKKLTHNSLHFLEEDANKYGYGSMLQAEDGKIYWAYSNKMYYIPNMDIYNNIQKNKSLIKIDKQTESKMNNLGVITNEKFNINGELYIVSEGNAYKIENIDMPHFNLGRFIKVDQEIIKRLSISKMTRLVRYKNDHKIFYIEDGFLRHVTSMTEVNRLGGNITVINDNIIIR